jgi:Uma2 family endonuclease
MSTAARLITADELLGMPADGFRYELVEGELRQMTPAGYEHGDIVGELHWRIGEFVHRHRLGRVLAAETGFLLSRNPDTVRAPDIAFIRAERRKVLGAPRGFFPEAPALVVEAVSPSDTVYELDAKMRNWLTAGVELGWVITPSARMVTVYRSQDDIQVLTEKDVLTGENVWPGFECAIADLFASL